MSCHQGFLSRTQEMAIPSKRSLLLGVALFASCLFVMLLGWQPDQQGVGKTSVLDESESGEHSDSVRGVAGTGEVRPETLSLMSSLQDWLPDANNTLANYFTSRGNSTMHDSRYTDGKLVYLHLNKAAGTTTKSCLKRLGKKIHNGIAPVLASSGRTQLEQSRNFSSKIFMGGYSFGICDLMKSRACSYFTFQRNPYERVLSSYTYCRSRRSGDQTCARGILDARNASLKEWAMHQGSYFFRQLLMKEWFCSYRVNDTILTELVGIPHNRNSVGLPCWWKQKLILNNSLSRDEMDTLLKYCLENLEDWFSFIGLTSEYDLSLAMLEKVYKLPFAKECTGNWSNKSQDSPKSKVKTESLNKLQSDNEVREAMRADLEIYAKAVEIFEREKTVFLAN